MIDNVDSNDEDELEYSGSVDESGLPHGRGTISYNAGVSFTGRFQSGEKHGRGIFTFEDGSMLSGRWINDALEGNAEYISSDGTVRENKYALGECIDGSLGVERIGKRIIYSGNYNKDGERHGQGTLFLWSPIEEHTFCSNSNSVVLDGQLKGEWMNGVLSGTAAFIYADNLVELRGNWKDGNMKAATVVGRTGVSFQYDPPTATHISRTPTIPDPYESLTVEVRLSNIPHVCFMF